MDTETKNKVLKNILSLTKKFNREEKEKKSKNQDSKLAEKLLENI